MSECRLDHEHDMAGCLDCPCNFAPASRGYEAHRMSLMVTAVGKPVMIMRSLRVPADLWAAAKAKADERGENISDVLREALERYVKRR